MIYIIFYESFIPLLWNNILNNPPKTNIMKTIIFILISIIISTNVYSQITERTLPTEWNNLIKGGRFMDRFTYMPKGKLEKGNWGAYYVHPRYTDNGIENKDISFWGGNILQSPDKKFHLFVCGWKENSPKGHMAWSNSIVYHAISEKLHGPYTINDTIGIGHNPEAFITNDGNIIIYTTKGYYKSKSLYGPWTRNYFEFDKRDRKIIEGLSNLTFAKRNDGSFLMVCRGGGVWISRNGTSKYQQITEKRIYPEIEGKFEDPVIWRDSLQYHLIVNDWYGRIAYYERSKDGVNWVVEQGEAYKPGISFHKNGHVEKWFKYERAKVFQDKEGRAIQMNFAVIDTIKWNDLPNDNHSSKNICIPLNKGLLLEVLNKTPINKNTEKIELLIKHEKGFNPNKDLNIESLIFGTYTEVNYGRGAKVIARRKSGKDLIVTFEAHNSKITPDEFAPKLIGKDRKGELIYGYAKLPYINYNPEILSTRKPNFDNIKNKIYIEVENFGLSSSKEANIIIEFPDKRIIQSLLKPLKPYEKTAVEFNNININELKNCTVRITYNDKVIHKQQW